VSKNNQFLIATEVGILSRMRQENPSKEFIPIKSDAICKYMKKITIEKVYNSLVNEVYDVKVPENIARKAIVPIERMLAIS
jgi:quinolinate synthase